MKKSKKSQLIQNNEKEQVEMDVIQTGLNEHIEIKQTDLDVDIPNYTFERKINKKKRRKNGDVKNTEHVELVELVEQVVEPIGQAEQVVEPIGQAEQVVEPIEQAVSPVEPIEQAVSPVEPIEQAVSPVEPIEQAVSPVELIEYPILPASPDALVLPMHDKLLLSDLFIDLSDQNGLDDQNPEPEQLLEIHTPLPLVSDTTISNDVIRINEEQYKKCIATFSSCYMQNLNSLKYYPCSGIPNSILSTYTEFIHDRAKVFFKILNDSKILYYVFAGSSIGYSRNKKNIPWADDYDIIIFHDHIQKFQTLVAPILELNEFSWYKTSFGVVYMSHKPEIEQNKKQVKNYFQCDIFYSTYRNGYLKNALCLQDYGGGLYNRKNIPKTFVEPAIYKDFDDMHLPFFNNISQDIRIEYGDVINSCVLHIKHRSGGEIKGNWEDTYKVFDLILTNAKNNVKSLIYVNPDYQPLNSMKLDDSFKNITDIMQYISRNNIKTIYAMSITFIKSFITLKYYFPELHIILYLFDDNHRLATYFNYIDEVKFKYLVTRDYYNNSKIEYLTKPKFKLINVITFGTFDMLHMGHINILKRAKQHGYNLYIGISSDELNKQKNKQTVQDYDTICKNIKDLNLSTECFKEESLEQKNEYIIKYKCDLLIMGDDWRDKFDWVDCPVLYLPRTPDISTTIIKNKMDSNQAYSHLLYFKNTDSNIRSTANVRSNITEVLNKTNTKTNTKPNTANLIKPKQIQIQTGKQVVQQHENTDNKPIVPEILTTRTSRNTSAIRYVLKI
jgi:glycerol-3-phosphate cytidylyltransferase